MSLEYILDADSDFIVTNGGLSAEETGRHLAVLEKSTGNSEVKLSIGNSTIHKEEGGKDGVGI